MKKKFIIVVMISLTIPLVGLVKADIIIVRHDGTGDYPTIQAAIDTATPGDDVVLEQGVYTGPGNRNLLYYGKAITVRSQNPENDTCMRNTIIDARGEGVIVRFIYDEGPDCIFTGFTLGAGDTSMRVRGISGFFEFSINSKPTTKRLRSFTTDKSMPSAYDPDFLTYLDNIVTNDSLSSGWDAPLGGRAWDGLNPFHQPANTTDYYGSGDVDNDGSLTMTDVIWAQDIINGMAHPVYRADVDGDGDIDSDDVTLITSAINDSQILPGWWNNLTSISQRHDWIDQIIQIERTDEHLYYYDYFVCHDFAYQTYIHCAFLRADFPAEYVEYDGGHTLFNIPLYYVSVGAPAYHAINGILIGDDPLNFEDWYFIEPQTDQEVSPGSSSMLYGSSIYINMPTLFGKAANAVGFYVDESGWSLISYNDNLIMTRPLPDSVTVDNRPDLWNPRIIPAYPDMILFERAREDMTHTTDIHVAELPFVDPPACFPLVRDSQFSRLFDIYPASDGTFHLLWEGKDDLYQQSVFHGIFDPADDTFGNVTQASIGIRMPCMGRVIETPNHDLHVFWYEYHYLGAGVYDTGIYWTTWTGNNWEEAQSIAPNFGYNDGNPNWINRQFHRYLFDVEVLDNGYLILVWGNVVAPEYQLTELTYNGTWNSSVIATASWNNGIRGVDLCKGSDGILHLVYWLGAEQGFYEGYEGRGDLYHCTWDGVSWSNATLVSADSVACPRMTPGASGEIYLVMEKKIVDQVVPVWNKYDINGWQAEQVLAVRPDADAWYPTIDRLPDGRIITAWSSRSWDRVTIETKIVEGGTNVVSRHIFYNNCNFDNNHASANPDDDKAIAPDKTALLPGKTATAANYTSFSRGINGIMIDIAGLPGTPTDADFVFKTGNDNNPASWKQTQMSPSVTIRPGAGNSGTDRITLIWPDNYIQKQWLQVTVLATANTDLPENDVFYFGNAIGDSCNSIADTYVNAFDTGGVRDNSRNFLNPAPIDDPYDFNRDQSVNALDFGIARDNATNLLTALKLITAPAN